MINTRCERPPNFDAAAPAPHVSRRALRCTPSPALTVPSYAAVAITAMPDKRWGATGADRFHRSEYPGKHLTAAANFHPGLNDVANTGDAHLVARTNHSQGCF